MTHKLVELGEMVFMPYFQKVGGKGKISQQQQNLYICFSSGRLVQAHYN